MYLKLVKECGDKPDLMKEMYDEKINHLISGATTSWVPSPMAACIHTLHYHKQIEFKDEVFENMCKPPLWTNINDEDVKITLKNVLLGMQGYVKKWIHEGIGCSKIKDSNDIFLMEDRATLRISSQLMHNWLLHKLINLDTIEKMLTCDNDTKNCILELIKNASTTPEGYTENVLYFFRQKCSS